MGESEVKKCPKCGGEMEIGYLPGAFSWSAGKNLCGIAILDYRAVGETPKSFLKKCVQCGKDIPIASEECIHCRAEQPEYEEA